jgi:hypothetical protein
MTRNIQQLPNNSGSTSIVEVATNTGFNAGDTVYFNNGDYKGASNLTAPSKANFPIPLSPSILSGGSGGLGFPFNTASQLITNGNTLSGASILQNQANLIAQFTAATGTSGAFTVSVTTATGIANGQAVQGAGIGFGATVTNVSGTTITLSVANSATISGNLSFLTGNIVQVFTAFSGDSPCFRIVNSSNAVVTGPTQIGAGSLPANYGLVTVTALTGGGFAVAWENSTSSIYVAVYSNTGTVVTAPFTDALPAGSQNSQTKIRMTSLANGGFVVVTVNTSNNLYFKIYTAIGGATTSFTQLPTSIQSSPDQFSVASRSDSSFIVVYPSASTVFRYYLYNSSGGSITNSTISTTGNAMYYACDVCCLADGTTYVLSYNDYTTGNTDVTPYIYLLPTGNTLGSVIKPVPQSNTYSGGWASGNSFTGIVRLLPQYTGGFCVFYASGLGGALYYFFSNASATVFSPGLTSAGFVVPQVIPSTYIFGSTNNVSVLSVLENNSNITLYVNSWASGYKSVNMMGFNISETTYVITPQITGTYNVAPTVSASVSSVALSQSAPTGLKYYASNTESDLYSAPAASLLVSPTRINSINTDTINSCTLTNGNIVVAYRLNGGATTSCIYISIFNSQGVLLQTLNPSLAYAAYGSALYLMGVRVCALQGGKFAVGYPTQALTPYSLGLLIYSSSFSLTYNGYGPLDVGTNVYGESTGWDMCGLSTDQIMFAYPSYSTSNYLCYQAFTNAGISVASQTTIITSYQNPKICANSYGGFSVVTYYNGASTEYIFNYYPTSSTTWASITSGSLGGNTTSSSTTPTFKPFHTNGGALVCGCQTASGANYGQINCFDANGIAGSSWYVAPVFNTPCYGNVSTNYGKVGFGPTGYGTLTVAYVSSTSDSTTLNITGYVPTGVQVQNANLNTYSYSFPASSTTTASININATYGGLWVTSALGYSSFIIWRDPNGYPNYLVANTLPYISYANLVANTTVSSVVPVYPNNTSTSGAITNTVFSGVAATTASAGGTGQVIINGSAQLNSSYPSSGSGAFDHQGQGVNGVKGTYNGKFVNLQGNT